MSEYSAPVGAPIWADLMSSDPDAVVDFYSQIFGWEAEAPRAEFGGYRNFTRNGHRVAGLSPAMDPSGPSNVWTVYLRTDDAEATSAAAQAAGAGIIVPPMAVGDEGTMLVVADPAGAAIGFWQPQSHNGFAQWGEHGTPYWLQCMSTDYATSREFYSTVIDARLDEIGTGGDPDAQGPDYYSQVFVDESAYSGIMDASTMLPPGTPSIWQLYVTVEDVATTVDQVASLGGSVVMPADVTPWGTLAAVADPFGAAFCLGHPPAGM